MRRRIALLVAATSSLVVIAFLVPLAVLIRDLAVDRAMAAGMQDAQSTAVVVAVVPDRAELQQALAILADRSTRRTSVVLPDGTTYGRAPAAPDELVVARSGRAFTAQRPDGRLILVPVDTQAGRAVVLTLVPPELLRTGVVPSLAVLVGLGVVLLVIAVVLADRLAVRALRPVAALAGTAHRLAAGDLDARSTVHDPPELGEVGTALNRLAARIGELLTHEREAVADLSHRLRTPMAALRLDAEALGDPRVEQHVAALERMVDSLIREARRPVRAELAARCDAVAVVRDRVGFWSVLAEDTGRPVELRLPGGSLPVRLTAPDLGAAVDALLENVFSHTPDGTPMRVSVTPEPTGGAVLEVADDGPGLPPAASLRGHSDGGSTGLGVDIVRRAAESSGGWLELGATASGGARVRVHLGAAEG
ncbi:MAG TPA: HAMP domain-containing sensor histidine kinase [Mycobacteriales bacterium]|nr:HAMP domain-containing sensor histidine kinase [Mycobacteriales bacterium]